MSNMAAAFDVDGTAASTATLPRVKRRRMRFLPVGGLLVLSGTSSAEPHVRLTDGYALPLESSSGESPWSAAETQVDSGPDRKTPSAIQARDAIFEVRRLPGLTWEQTARLFGVSRRSVHFWVSGAAISPSHLERVRRVLAVLRAVDRGSAAQNRSIMFEPSSDGSLPFDDLATGRWETALKKMGPGGGRRAAVGRPLSPEARAARNPPAPAELVDALNDRVHREGERTRVARPGRTTK